MNDAERDRQAAALIDCELALHPAETALDEVIARRVVDLLIAFLVGVGVGLALKVAGVV